MFSSALNLKRSHSPSRSGSSKKQCLTSTVVVPADCSNGTRVPVNGDPLSITSHKAATEVLRVSNSCDLQVETDGDQKIVVAAIREGELEREEPAMERKKKLPEMLDERLFVLESFLSLSGVQMEERTESLRRCKKDLVNAKHIYKSEVFDILLRALNDVIFNPSPTPGQKNHRGTGVLDSVDIENLKKKSRNYINKILQWTPNDSTNVALKAKALSCLTQQQQELADFLVTQAIHDFARTARNTSQHPRTSKPFARVTNRRAFEELKLAGTAHSKLSFAHFDDVIENAIIPLGGGDSRTLFLEQLEDEEPDCPPMLEKRISHLGAQIEQLGKIIQGAAERRETLLNTHSDSFL